MTIREKGYHSWSGSLNTAGLFWLPMFKYGIRAVSKKKYAKGLFGFMLLPFFIFMIALWVSSKPELKMLDRLVRMLEMGEDKFFNTFYTNDQVILLFIILAIFAGAELISNDLRTNSFPLYFARPLERKDYIYGKYSILMFYLLLFSLVPGIVIYIFKFIFAGKMAIQLQVLLGLFTVPVITAFFIASITLMLSSTSSNSRNVKIFLFLIYASSAGIAQAAVELFGKSHFYMLSMVHNIHQMGTFIFGIEPAYRYPAWLSLVVVIGVSLVAYRIIYKRIGKAEAQIESGN